ncbi:MAG TPA: NmrA/HSCARG family protein [Bryobacteraceae bacterium]|nr:NmrA/HSCARG family protein [Bryobacteraceae bacterium]
MAKHEKLILVAGATGKQGGAALRHLREKGFAVRAITRDPDQAKARALAGRGVEVLKGDLDDVASIARALDGVYGVFSVQNSRAGAEAEIRQGINLVEAARRAVVDHFVYSSVGSADQQTGIPHFDSKFQIEERIRATGIPYTILRPVFFMENWLAMRDAIEQGAIALPLKPETRLQMIAVDDIGAFVALAFEHPGKWRGQAIDIAGDEHSMFDTARVLSGAAGREVSYQQISWDQFEQGAGHEITVMYRWFEATGYHADISVLRQSWPNLLTLERWSLTHWARATAATS